MTSADSSQADSFSGMKGHDQQEEELRNEPKALVASNKVFVCRNSVLTDLVEANRHIRSLYSLLFAICLFLFIQLSFLYWAEPSLLWDDLSVLRYGASNFSSFVILWLLLNLLAFVFYEGFKLWISVRSRIIPKAADRLFLYLYIVAFISTFLAGTFSVFKMRVGHLCAFSIAIEQVRIYMKIHSYVRGNIPRVLQYKLKNDGNDCALYPTRKHYLYYLFAPTFIYRDSYPRVKTIRWGKGLFHLFEMFLVMFVSYYQYMRFHKDWFKNVGLQPLTKKEAVFFFAWSLLTGSTYLLLMNYGIIHCWINFTGEFLRFGDREFYQDWWNSETITQYFRQWNLPVHEFLHSFLYVDFQKLGYSRLVSMTLVFAVSSLFHDYAFCVGFGYFYPLLFVYHICTAITFSLFPLRGKTFNFSKWPLIVFGWGLLVSLYATEYYARVNCRKEETIVDFFKPRTWDPSCRILEFSLF